jgi:putative acetyltransferase
MNITIRHEMPEDFEAVKNILIAAFPTDAESRLVELLRQNGKAILSLVAVQESIVGYVLFSPVITHPSHPAKGLGLAPVAVHPNFQSQGIGAKLIREGLRQCKELGCDFIVLLGNPKYYQRFGFQNASSFGLQNEYGVDDEFMSLELVKDSLHGARTLVMYQAEFFDLNV